MATQLGSICLLPCYLSSSGVLMDLRFIPDDMEFDDAPKEKATEVPTDYEPRQFVASAMQQSSVKLTWYVVKTGGSCS